MARNTGYSWAVALGLTFLAGSALADSAQGVWLRAEGTSKVKIEPCGDALCGVVVWLKDPNSPSKIGEKVFFGMKPSGSNSWTGSAYNPEDGRTYDGQMKTSGDHLVTTGCALGGMICRSVSWTRSK
ncbi:MAG: DUF2147 domain-containing protein [Beijerinckiaceae bacterium]|nr:DUF2147 domain-containing protein [Beijerinckiaceae bacterium]